MTTKNNINVTVHDPQTQEQLAEISLNGHSIRSGGPLGNSGAMRSFKIVDGDLWTQWERQVILIIRAGKGKEARVRVAAMPVELGGLGFIEFV